MPGQERDTMGNIFLLAFSNNKTDVIYKGFYYLTVIYFNKMLGEERVVLLVVL